MVSTASSPQYIRQSQLDNVALFFDDQEAATVYDAYQLVDENSSDYSELVQTVPALEAEPVYVLKDLTNDELAQIEPAMSRGLLVLYLIEQIQNNPDQAAEMLGDLPFDPSQIPAGMDLFTVLRMAPDRLEEIKQQITVQFESIPETLSTQMTTAAIQQEYEALGVDLGKDPDQLYPPGGRRDGSALTAFRCDQCRCELSGCADIGFGCSGYP